MPINLYNGLMGESVRYRATFGFYATLDQKIDPKAINNRLCTSDGIIPDGPNITEPKRYCDLTQFISLSPLIYEGERITSGVSFLLSTKYTENYLVLCSVSLKQTASDAIFEKLVEITNGMHKIIEMKDYPAYGLSDQIFQYHAEKETRRVLKSLGLLKERKR